MATTPFPQTSSIVRDLLALGVLRISADGSTILLPDGTAYTPAAGAADWNTLQNKPAVIAAGANQAAARTVIGAGISNLAIGTTSATAKAGDWVPPAGAAVANATDGTDVVAQFNALLASLRAAGFIQP